MTDYDVAALLAERAEDVCRYLLPNGRRVGREWKAGSVHGEAGDSLGVVLGGDKAGIWADFASDDSGDLIGLWKLARGVDTATAFKEAEAFLGLEPRRLNGHAMPIVRPVARADAPIPNHPKLGRPSATWAYRDASGGILGYACRFDPAGERKQVLPLTWDGAAWVWRGFAEPRPLYGLERLAARPDAPVLVVEGEKCADAAAALLSGMAAVSWPGGCKAIGKVDLEPLRGRVVTLWPDADDAGKEAMQALAERLGQPCRIVRPNGEAEGWDVADAAAEGWDTARVQAWAKAHVDEWFPAPAPEILEETHERVSDFVPPPAIIQEAPFNLFDTLPVPALERDALPWAIADYVFDQSALIGTDPGILGLACLVTLAGCADDAVRCQPKQYEYGWRESARLWGAVVAGPAEKKSPPIRRAVSHLRQIDMKLAEEVSARMDVYERERAEYERIRARAKGAPIAMDPPERPKERCLMIDDATTEAIGRILRDNPRGLLQVRDELSGWFGSMDAYSGAQGKDAAFLLECYEGGPGKVSRITRDGGPIPNKSLCILGGIQPDPMRKIANRLNEDGLLQRFIIVCPRPADGLGEDRPPKREAEDSYTQVLEWIIGTRGDKDRPVLFSVDARRILGEITAEADAYSKRPSTPRRMRVHLGKWQGLFVRLALLYHLIECAALGQPHDGTEVTRGTAETVRKLMFDYLLPHLDAFYNNVLDASGVIEHARWIAGYLLAHEVERFTLRDIQRAYSAWSRLIKPEQQDVIRYLDDCAWIERDGRGWLVNPAVHSAFPEQASVARAYREAVSRMIQRSAETKREDKR